MNPLAALPPESLGAMAFAVGLVVGSFLNVVIYRLPRGESLVRPGSHCPGCGQGLAPWDNVPVLSFFRANGFVAGSFVQLELDLEEIE